MDWSEISYGKMHSEFPSMSQKRTFDSFLQPVSQITPKELMIFLCHDAELVLVSCSLENNIQCPISDS